MDLTDMRRFTGAQDPRVSKQERLLASLSGPSTHSPPHSVGVSEAPPMCPAVLGVGTTSGSKTRNHPCPQELTIQRGRQRLFEKSGCDHYKLRYLLSVRKHGSRCGKNGKLTYPGSQGSFHGGDCCLVSHEG